MGNIAGAIILSLFSFLRNMVRVIILSLSHRGKVFLLMEVVSPTNDITWLVLPFQLPFSPGNFVFPEEVAPEGRWLGWCFIVITLAWLRESAF
jgi:hypothetical protein